MSYKFRNINKLTINDVFKIIVDNEKKFRVCLSDINIFESLSSQKVILFEKFKRLYFLFKEFIM